MNQSYEYGFWMAAIVSAAVFVLFALSFAKPGSPKEWKSMGAFSAFVVALFAEMYGFPLTIYLLSGWLTSTNPDLDLYTYTNGHLWNTLLGIQGDAHLSIIHFVSIVLIGAGMYVIARSWRVLHTVQREGRLAMTGPYRYVRHPQYAGFIGILTGLLVQWPTLLTLVIYPVLVLMYIRLARKEERTVLGLHGEEYGRYALTTPAFLPRISRAVSDSEVHLP